VNGQVSFYIGNTCVNLECHIMYVVSRVDVEGLIHENLHTYSCKYFTCVM